MSKPSLLYQSKALRYTVVIGVAGVITMFLMVYVQRSMLTTYDRNIPYVSLGETVKSRTLRAHLEFEELLAGDQSRNFNEGILKQLSSAKALLQAAYDGGTTEIGAFQKNEDEDVRILLKESIVSLDRLIETSTQRHNLAATNTETAGSQGDQ